jgi:hypothetical protein
MGRKHWEIAPLGKGTMFSMPPTPIITVLFFILILPLTFMGLLSYASTLRTMEKNALSFKFAHFISISENGAVTDEISV